MTDNLVIGDFAASDPRAWRFEGERGALSRAHGLRLDTLLFGWPVPQVVALARLALSVIALAAVHASPPQLQAPFIQNLMLVYAACAVAAAGVCLVMAPPACLAYLGHVLDVIVSAVLMYGCDGAGSPFVALLVFTLLSSAAQWDWRSTLATAISLLLAQASVILLAHAAGGAPARGLSEDLVQAGLQGGLLLACGSVVACFAGLREQSRSRFQRLAESCAGSAPDPRTDCLKEMTRRAADLLAADHVSVSFILKPTLQGTVIECCQGAVRGTAWPVAGGDPTEPLDRAVRGGPADSVTEAAFDSANCWGWIVARRHRAWSPEDRTILRILADRIGAEVEERGRRAALQATAARQERERLARDLHDGPLQGIAAANLQLGIMSQQVPEHVQVQLRATRDLLCGEADRIRSAIRSAPASPEPIRKLVRLVRLLDEHVDQLRRLWGCTIRLDIAPMHLRATRSDVAHLTNMVSEAVSNAVRHGRATKVEISVRQTDDRLILSIRDNGTGCLATEGTYPHSALAAGNLGPQTLRSRAEALGGSISLVSSRHGTALHIEFAT
ncbi:histidine kinase [Methylobacterium durans]|uniref:sensor histidine kinase n=1 Tax=Methylobacterium durans TaxID=2202825 RepID=UPI002AFF5A25|nr:ATP-binding protein [Methylobacterium durans]MEA1833887.1 histidine kinase [Methylobacterium durans]